MYKCISHTGYKEDFLQYVSFVKINALKLRGIYVYRFNDSSFHG